MQFLERISSVISQDHRLSVTEVICFRQVCGDACEVESHAAARAGQQVRRNASPLGQGQEGQ